jgi:hypothetical protein
VLSLKSTTFKAGFSVGRVSTTMGERSGSIGLIAGESATVGAVVGVFTFAVATSAVGAAVAVVVAVSERVTPSAKAAKAHGSTSAKNMNLFIYIYSIYNL